MNETKITLEKLTKKWWFFMMLFGAQFILFPITTKNFEFSEVGRIIGKTLSNSIMGDLKNYYLYFQIPSIIVIILLAVYKNKVRKLFAIYVVISYILFSFLQNIATTEDYGVSIVSINVAMFLFVSYAWTKELLDQKNQYSFQNLNWKTSWLILISILCFWWPLSWKTLEFTLDPLLLINNGSSLAFCAMTPIFLAIMTFNLPTVNIATYRITALIGGIIGFYNMLNFFNPRTINIAVIHLPLLLVSTYSFILSYKKAYNKT